jgi:hypothetical protein
VRTNGAFFISLAEFGMIPFVQAKELPEGCEYLAWNDSLRTTGKDSVEVSEQSHTGKGTNFLLPLTGGAARPS